MKGLEFYLYETLSGFSGSSAGKESTCNAGDPGSISGSGRSSGKGIGYPLRYSWLPWWLSWWRLMPTKCVEETEKWRYTCPATVDTKARRDGQGNNGRVMRQGSSQQITQTGWEGRCSYPQGICSIGESHRETWNSPERAAARLGDDNYEHGNWLRRCVTWAVVPVWFDLLLLFGC